MRLNVPRRSIIRRQNVEPPLIENKYMLYKTILSNSPVFAVTEAAISLSSVNFGSSRGGCVGDGLGVGEGCGARFGAGFKAGVGVGFGAGFGAGSGEGFGAASG